ncbi:MAG TPA: nuclease-related domain-containing protein [Solirubrobacterales bacterium]
MAEERVGSRLWKLEELGWLVEHDVQKGGGGNIDHVVQSPAVTFVIETKAGASGSCDLSQVLRHAEWAVCHYGSRREIVPVLCLQRSRQGPELIEGIHAVGASNLVGFMLDRG